MGSAAGGPEERSTPAAQLPRRPRVTLRRKQLARLLGASLPAESVQLTLEGLEMQTTPRADGWDVTPPSYRFDIAIEAALIEEVARIVGFEAIPEADAFVPQRFRPLPE